MSIIDTHWRVGVDSGGTFTDVCIIGEQTGATQIWKLSSTPSDPSLAIAESVAEALAANNISAEAVSYFGHGTTVGTNALLEKRGARIALVTTAGFKDLIEIGRQQRPHLYDMQADKTSPLVDRLDRFEMKERVLHDGTVEVAFDENEARALAARLREAGYDAVAVCFLYGFAFPEHEIAFRDILLAEIPGLFVTISSDIAPEFREYERTSTTVANAYLGPIMRHYLSLLAGRLNDGAIAARPHLTQSNGGVISFQSAANHPIKTVLSGPAAGIVAAAAIGERSGFANIITFDMGGTSSDLAVLTGGRCTLATNMVVEGYPLKVPALDIHTVGAGGGSFAYIDAGGLMKVGPKSAGGFPGPACYGHGTAQPTVTDANVILQLLNPRELLCGRMQIDRELSVAAMRPIASRLGVTVEEGARGTIAVAIANMARSIRMISVQRGHDPRDYALMAFGGAGPLHAAWLAAELDIGKVIIPETPGTLCAQGLLLADLRVDFTAMCMITLEAGRTRDIRDLIDGLAAKAEDWFEAEHIDIARRSTRVVADMRYAGQNFELSVTVDTTVGIDAFSDALKTSFAAQHRKEYGFADDNRAIELVVLRLEAAGAVPKPVVQVVAPGTAEPDSDALLATRRANFSGREWIECPIYARDKLHPGNKLFGPAIIEQMDTTTIVPPGMLAHVDPWRNLIIEVRPE